MHIVERLVFASRSCILWTRCASRSVRRSDRRPTSPNSTSNGHQHGSIGDRNCPDTPHPMSRPCFGQRHHTQPPPHSTPDLPSGCTWGSHRQFHTNRSLCWRASDMAAAAAVAAAETVARAAAAREAATAAAAAAGSYRRLSTVSPGLSRSPRGNPADRQRCDPSWRGTPCTWGSGGTRSTECREAARTCQLSRCTGRCCRRWTQGPRDCRTGKTATAAPSSDTQAHRVGTGHPAQSTC